MPVSSVRSSWVKACHLWGSVLRGDNEPILLAHGSNIQEHCVLHVDSGFLLTIGANCTIGHKAMLHGCRCLISQTHLITENAEIPDGSLVISTPAKVKRSLRETKTERFLKSAKNTAGTRTALNPSLCRFSNQRSALGSAPKALLYS